QADPVTYVRVVELLAEGAGSVGWNVANNSVGQLVTLGLSDEGVDEIYARGADTVIAGTAVMGGGRAVPVDGGYRVTGRWPFGTGCQESSWMLGSFQIFDGVEPRRSHDGSSVFWRGIFARSEAQIVEGSWEVSGMRATGSFDWTVDDVFLPERRTMVHAGVPLDNQWKRWPGVSYALPAQAWVGPHHSAVITGIARAGIDALIELAAEKTPRGRTARLCDNPQVQDAVGRADTILNAGRAYRSATITEVWNTVAAGDETTLDQRARCRLAAVYASESARQAMDLMYQHGCSTSYRPEMAQRLEALRLSLRDEASLPQKLQELVMLSVAAEMGCAFIWYAHAAPARKAGVRDDVVDNIREKRAPANLDPEEQTVVDFTRELLQNRKVSRATFDAATARFGQRGTMTLTNLIACYALLAYNMNTYELEAPAHPTEKALP